MPSLMRQRLRPQVAWLHVMPVVMAEGRGWVLGLALPVMRKGIPWKVARGRGLKGGLRAGALCQ
jgi:hypothetical protein